MTRFIGIDIGGANTKLASSDSKISEIHYLPMWKGTGLTELLNDISSQVQPDRVAIVMTGELADCFESKEEGLRFISNIVNKAFNCPVHYINQSGEFAELINTDIDIYSFAAANWAASSRLIAKDIGDCIFVDMGSTTTDIIPIINGRHSAQTSDLKRLCKNQLVYTGILRTNVATLLSNVNLGDCECRIASELFATTADVYRSLENIGNEDYICDTADGAGKEKRDCFRRLARIVCADLTEISHDNIISIAEQVKETQKDIISTAITNTVNEFGLTKIICAGIGEFLLKEICIDQNLDFELSSDLWGSKLSDMLPAYAAARILEMEYDTSTQARR